MNWGGITLWKYSSTAVQLATHTTVCCTMGTLVADSAGNIYGYHFSQNFNIMYLPVGASNGATLGTFYTYPNQNPYYNGITLASFNNLFYTTNVASNSPLIFNGDGTGTGLFRNHSFYYILIY